MKKFSKYFVAATIVVTATAAILVGCKKENDEPKDNGRQSEAAVLVNRINNFSELRDAVNSGAKADGSMTVEEMREILCMVSNYEHSEHETFCHNTVLDTLEVRMVPMTNGNVLESDVVAVYNAFETELESCMESVDDGMDVPSLFSIVLPENGARDEEDIKIIFTRGQEADQGPNCLPLLAQLKTFVLCGDLMEAFVTLSHYLIVHGMQQMSFPLISLPMSLHRGMGLTNFSIMWNMWNILLQIGSRLIILIFKTIRIGFLLNR